jgi:hypothetical protein
LNKTDFFLFYSGVGGGGGGGGGGGAWSCWFESLVLVYASVLRTLPPAAPPA